MLKGSAISSSGTSVQVHLRGRTSGSYPVEKVSLVQRTGSTLNGQDATARAVTFGGASRAIVPPGGLISDPVPFNLVAGQDVFLTFWAPAGTGGVYRTGGSGTTTWFIMGTDQSAVIDWGSLNISGTRSYVYGAELLTSQTSSPPPPPGTAWTAGAQSSGGSWKNSGFDNRTFRILLKGSAISSSGTSVQVHLRGRTSGSYPVEKVSLVQRTGSTLNGQDATARAVTFGGASRAIVPPGGLISDPVPFNLVAGQDVFLTFWAPAGTGGVYRTGGSGTTTWFIMGTDQSAVIDWGSLNISGTRSYVYGAELLTSQTSSPPPPPGTAWTAGAQSSGGSWKNSGFDNRTFRILLKGSAISSSGTSVQVHLRGRTSGSYPVEKVSLVQRTGSTLNGQDATARAVTFGGASRAIVPPGGLISDPVPFNLVAGQDVFLTFWAPAGTGGVYRTGGSGTTTWFIMGTDQSAVIDWGSLNISGTRSYVYGAELLTSQTTLSSGPVASVTTAGARAEENASSTPEYSSK